MSQVTDYILPPEGRAYKENVPDTRESPVKKMVKELKEFGVDVYGYDPLLTKEEIEEFSVKALDELNAKVDCVVAAVAHDEFKNKPFLKKKAFSERTTFLEENFSFLSTGSFFQILGKFNQNASQKESVLMCAGCLAKKKRRRKVFIIGEYDKI